MAKRMSGGGKSNDDFRKLLETPMRARKPQVPQGTSETAPTQEDKKKDDAESAQRKKQKSKTHHAKKQKRTEEMKERQEELNSKYRDRAKERREGKGELVDLGVDVDQMEPEMTQHLGGDIEHTHLVKGMDWTLLARVTENISQGKSSIDGLGHIALPGEDPDQPLATPSSSSSTPLDLPSGSTTTTKTTKEAPKSSDSALPPRVRRTIAGLKELFIERREAEARRQSKKKGPVAPIETFLSGRSSFCFVVEGPVTEYRQMIPTTILHSIEETRKYKPKIRLSLADTTSQRVIKTFSTFRKQGRRKFVRPTLSSLETPENRPQDLVASAYPDKPIAPSDCEEFVPFFPLISLFLHLFFPPFALTLTLLCLHHLHQYLCWGRILLT